MKIQCPHSEQDSGRQVCPHLAEGLYDTWTTEQFGHYRLFTGRGLDYVLTCQNCREQSVAQLPWVCGECFVDIAHGKRLGSLGQPEIPQAEPGLQLQQLDRWPRQPRIFSTIAFGQGWAALTAQNELVLLDAGRRRAFPLSKWGMLADEQHLLLAAEPYVVVAPVTGDRGVVLDTGTGQVTMEFKRDPAEAGRFPLAVTPRHQLIHGTRWNQLTLSDLSSGQLVKTLKVPQAYYQSSLSLSPDGQWLAMNGWIAHPMGSVRVLNLADDQPSRPLCQRDGFWDGPTCWLGPDKLAVWGLGNLDALLLPGIRIFEAASGRELAPIPGPEGVLTFDEHLYAHSPESGFSAWDIETGQRLFHDPQFHPLAYHPQQKVFLAQTPEGLTLNQLRP